MLDRLLALSLAASLSFASVSAQTEAALALREGDTVCIVGGSVAERMQHDGWLETRLQLRFPELGLRFRNLGFAGDSVTVRQRTDGFGSPEEHLERCKASVIFGMFGGNEAFADDPAGVETFRRDLSAWVKARRSRSFDGSAPPRIVLFTPLAHEDRSAKAASKRSDGAAEHARRANARLEKYAEAVRAVAKASDVAACVDLFAASHQVDMAQPGTTVYGYLRTEVAHRALAQVIEAQLFGDAHDLDPERASSVRAAVCEKNGHWFQRYRAVDGFNVYGGRSRLTFEDGISNRDVLQRELQMLDARVAHRDARIHAKARGVDIDTLAKEDLPPAIPVRTNRPGPEADGSYRFLDGVSAIEKMTVHEGMKVELFASEREFPELVNPVQMAFDTKGRLWVAVWPMYTRWNPTQEMRDALIILEDTDGDGRADSRTVFAGDLHNPTGFEFWNGGVLVAQAPDLIFLQDIDGDDVCDQRTRVLHGLSSADTHHTANSFVFGPGGGLHFQEGTFHRTQIESPTGVVRNRNGCVWRFEPRTGRIARHVPYNFANPHGHSFDRFGQDIVHDGTTAIPYHALIYNGHLGQPQQKHPAGPVPYRRRIRPAAASEVLSSRHFPESMQDNLLVANVIGLRGIQRYRIDPDGPTLRGEELEPIVTSDDENFRPVDMEVAPDGSLYFLDWHNPLIGHMQHHIRDPSRDNTHGRVYRVSCIDRPLVEAAQIDGATAADLVQMLGVPELRTRARARIELGSRRRDDVLSAAAQFAPDLITRLWIHQEFGAVDAELLKSCLEHERSQVRAAATRVLRHWRDSIPNAIELLRARGLDQDPLVRCEAIVAASYFRDAAAAEIAVSAARPDPDSKALRYVLRETLRQLEPWWREALSGGTDFVERGDNHTLLDRLDAAALSALPASPSVDRAVIANEQSTPEDRIAALRRSAKNDDLSVAARLAAVIQEADAAGNTAMLRSWLPLFASWAPEELAVGVADWRALAGDSSKRSVSRRIGFAALLRAGQPAATLPIAETADHVGRLAFFAGVRDVAPTQAQRETLRPFLAAAASSDADTRAAAGAAHRLRIQLPGKGTLTLAEVEVFAVGNNDNVAPGGKATQSSTMWAGVAPRAIDGKTDGTWSVGTSTHSRENESRPWWELEFAEPTIVERMQIWNRTDGNLGMRLDGFSIQLLDAQRDVVWEQKENAAPMGGKPAVIEVHMDPASAARAAARSALAHLDGTPTQAIETANAAARATGAPDPILALGEAVYARDGHCITCHQKNGKGLAPVYPPLAGTRWVLGDEERLIKIALNGLWGNIEVAGTKYASPPMPPMTAFRDLLDDKELAAVLTYVRSSWGNNAAAISPETVARVRKSVAGRTSFWRPEELLEQHPFSKTAGKK